jgi:D-apiose dehydrogenase
MTSADTKKTGSLIGAGFFAGFQAEAWMSMKDVAIVAVVDPAPGKAAAFAAQHGIPRSYTCAEAMLQLEQLDFVDIVTRPDTHLSLTRLAAQHRVHVICQKPMASTLVDSVAMCQACESAGVRLLIHENWRWQPWYREALRLIQSGTIGPLRHLSFDWRTGDGNGPQPYAAQPYFREMPQLIIHESLVHILDTFRCLAGELSITACKTRRVNPVIVGEDWAEIEVRFANGASGFIHGDRHTGPVPSPVAMGRMIIEGEIGTLCITPEGALLVNDEPLSFTPPTTGYKSDSVLATQQHLIHCLNSGQPAESEGRTYLRTARLVEDAYRIANLKLKP